VFSVLALGPPPVSLRYAPSRPRRGSATSARFGGRPIEGTNEDVRLRAVHAASTVDLGTRLAQSTSIAGSAAHEGRLRRQRGLVVGVFVASGAAGLVYQVVWSSQLVLVFGNTTEAIGTIVTAFMAGLGLGGLVGGWIAPRLRQPLRVYGVIEIAVGALALLVPWGFQLIDNVYRSAYDTTSPGQLTFVRLLLTLAAVTPVTFLMGLTLPLLTRHLVTSMRTAGARMAVLYSANTLGAMAGTLVSGFILIELIGLSATTHVAVGLNLLAGCTALLLAARPRVADAPIRSSDDEPEAVPAHGRLRALIYAATFVSGFVALSLEVLWTRMLAEGTGSQIYNFVGILAVFLLGIAAGGVAYRVAGGPSRDTPQTLALAFLGIALFTVLTVPVATLLVTTHNLARVLMLLPATVCMGYAFPLSARLLTRDPAHGARSIGFLYTWNTAGSILGSLAAAFILAGTLGTNGSILVLAAADAAVALVLMASGAKSLRAVPLRLSLTAGIALVVPPLLVITGAPVVQTATEHNLAARGAPFFHTEDRVSTVDAVGGPVSGRRLYASGTTMTALSVDTKMMAYVPKALRPNAQDFLDICFGMGTTFRSALMLGMHTDAVDLSPSIPLQMPVFYPDAERYLNSPLARVITADGRNYVRLTSRRYDLISVDPPPPIETAGASVLYSQEFYADAHRVLRSGGLMLQWLYFGVDLDQFREHLRTFRSEFRHVLLVISPRHGGVYMLGSDAAITWDVATISQLLESPQAAADIASAPDSRYLPNESWATIVASLPWLQDGAIDRFAGDGPMITDDHPLTEYYVLHQLFSAGHGQKVTEALLRRLG
jgi:spermidine synthase